MPLTAQVLDDIFVLRAVKGSDFFCIVSGLIDPQTVAEVKRTFAARKAEARPSVTPSSLNPKQLVSKTSFFSKDQQNCPAVTITSASSTGDEDDEDAEDLNIENIYVSAEKDI